MTQKSINRNKKHAREGESCTLLALISFRKKCLLKTDKFIFFCLKIKYKLYLLDSCLVYFLPDSKRKLFTYAIFLICSCLLSIYEFSSITVSILTSFIAASIFDFFINIISDIDRKKEIASIIVKEFSPVIWRKNYLISLIKQYIDKPIHGFSETKYAADDILLCIKQHVSSEKFEKEICPKNHKFERDYIQTITIQQYIEESIRFFESTLINMQSKNIHYFEFFFDRVNSIIMSYNRRKTEKYLIKSVKTPKNNFDNIICEQIIKYIRDVEVLEYFFYCEILPYSNSDEFRGRKSILVTNENFKKFVSGDN